MHMLGILLFIVFIIKILFVAKVKVINRNLNSNLTGGNFTDTPSNTIFSLGSFNVTSNFDDREVIDYSKSLSTFVRPVTLESMELTIEQSELLHNISTNLVLNLDNSNLNTFVKFGSTYEFLRVSIENIILNYPSGLFVNNQISTTTFFNYKYNEDLNQSSFSIPLNSIENTFNLIISKDNKTIIENNRHKNINISFEDFVVSTTSEPKIPYNVIGFTGFSKINNSISLIVEGNPFNITTTSGESGNLRFHIKPNNLIFEEFRARLKPYEKYIISERVDDDGFIFILKNPTLLDNGEIIYTNTSILWSTSDGYNIDIDTSSYRKFLEIVLTIGGKYDLIKTDLINRFLTPSSLKTYDLTENSKMIKLLRLYGWEFDQIRQFIDSLVYVNKISYDKKDNLSDQLVANLAKTFGWEYFSLVNENELMESFLTIDKNERNLNEDLLPAEIDLELWRRILNNTNYFWKSKGTRESIKSMFLLIGIPEPFINITEYVYTVDGKINPNTVPFSQRDFPTNSLPYDNFGYPKTPIETKDFYFQISGDTDSGQKYLDIFRMAGFNLNQTIDNKKSWIQTGSTMRIHNTTPQYYQKDSKLVINTKEVDVTLDTARGIEYDVFTYIKDIDFPANNARYALSYSYVNISLDGNNGVFDLPLNYTYEGDIEVRYNGILLNPPKSGNTSGFTLNTNADYQIINNKIIINELSSGISFDDVVQITFVNSGETLNPTEIIVNYIVAKVDGVFDGLTKPIITLPSKPNGDIQLTINGIALTKKEIGVDGDYTFNEKNNQIYINNNDVLAFLGENKEEIQVAYINVNTDNVNPIVNLTGESVNLKSETVKIYSFNTNKIFINESANKCVYKLNYRIKDAKEVKLLVDGIALEPYKDYDVNVMNPYEIFLPKGLRIGTVLSAYYLVGGNELFLPIVMDGFGLGDISRLSFLEFLELIQRKLINARTRKVITNSKGGWYPTVQKIYETYLKRANLQKNNPFLSNGYTFRNLHPFLNKYNAFFQRFIEQLLSATIILKKNGLLVRNSLFTRQKFTYKRGVNLYSHINQNNTYEDKRGHGYLKYLGDDGTLFKINQETEKPTLYVETISAYGDNVMEEFSREINSYICDSGGMNISGHSDIVGYGIQYKKYGVEDWDEEIIYDILTTDSYLMPRIKISPNILYEYRAIICEPLRYAVGNSYKIEVPQYCGLTSEHRETTESEILFGGGCCIVGYQNIDLYGMEYEYVCSNDVDFTVEPINYSVGSDGYIHVPSSGICVNLCICGEYNNTYEITCNNVVTPWLIADEPTYPKPTGIEQKIVITANTNCNNQCIGCVIYTPSYGEEKIIKIRQEKYIPPVEININESYYCESPQDYYPENGGCNFISVTTCGHLTPILENPNDEVRLIMDYYLFRDCINNGYLCNQVFVYCNNNVIFGMILCDRFGCRISCCGETSVLSSMPVKCGDCITFKTHAISQCKERQAGISRILIKSVTGDGYVMGSQNTLESKVCSIL